MTLDLFGPTAGAELSSDGRYRFSLWRRWAAPERPRVLWVMLNPSTADAEKDDATIRKIRGFVQLWAADIDAPPYGSLEVVNLFAWRATKPADLYFKPGGGLDRIGPGNDGAIANAVRRASRIVCAWGSHRIVSLTGRDREVMEIVRGSADPRVPIVALRLSQSGAPWHPLYVPYAERPIPF